MKFYDIISKFSAASFVFLILFIIISIIELIFAFFEKEKLRVAVKPFCLLTLGLFAVVTLPEHPLIYLGAFFSMLGDIFVVIKDKKYFSLGATLFFAAHLLYWAFLLINFVKFSFEPYQIIILCVSFVIFFAFLLIPSKHFIHKKFEMIGMPIYYATIFTSLPLYILTYVKVGSYMYLAIIGITLFIISDLIILFTKYIRKFKKYDFYIMLTYLLAQCLIIFSFVITAISLAN